VSAVALLIIVILTFAVFSVFFIEGTRYLGEAPGREEPEQKDRPWWGNPLVWIALSALFLILGVFVAPHFLPGVILFVPFIWIGRSRIRRFGGKDRR
jgi:Na+/proline symporter